MNIRKLLKECESAVPFVGLTLWLLLLLVPTDVHVALSLARWMESTEAIGQKILSAYAICSILTLIYGIATKKTTWGLLGLMVAAPFAVPSFVVTVTGFLIYRSLDAAVRRVDRARGIKTEVKP